MWNQGTEGANQEPSDLYLEHSADRALWTRWPGWVSSVPAH